VRSLAKSLRSSTHSGLPSIRGRLSGGRRAKGSHSTNSRSLAAAAKDSAASQLLDDAVVRYGLADHQRDAQLPGRFMLRTRYRPINEWRITWLSCCLPPLGMESASCSIGFSKLNSPAHQCLCLRFKPHLTVSASLLKCPPGWRFDKRNHSRVVGDPESAGMNGHVVGDERALQERK
jgi:hypothetical protein